MRGPCRRDVFLLSLAALFATPPSPVAAQAWLAPKGEATLAVGYQHLLGFDHLLFDGTAVDRGRMRWSSLILDAGYGVTDRFGIRIGVPYMFTKYTGDFPHLPPGRAGIDDGTWNHTLQDLRAEARYLATTGAFAITPFVAASVPLRGYETHAHSAAGKGLWEATAGVYAGRRLDPVLPDAYSQARVAFTVPERLLGVWHNRTNATFEVGYFVLPALTVRATAAWQVTHGGFRFPIDSPPGSASYLHHDPLMREQLVQIGGGASFAVTGSFDVFASATQNVRGRNSVEGRAFAVGAMWGFSPAQMIRKRRPSPPDAP
jgi:hypothetical protein